MAQFASFQYEPGSRTWVNLDAIRYAASGPPRFDKPGDTLVVYFVGTPEPHYYHGEHADAIISAIKAATPRPESRWAAERDAK